MSQRTISNVFCVGGIKSVGGLELGDGELGAALDVFVSASVWFGVRTVRLVVAQPGPAASLTDDLQLARLARAAAVATAVVLLAVATGQAHCWGLGRCCSRSVKIWRSHRQHSVQCSQSPSLQAGLYISPVNSNG